MELKNELELKNESSREPSAGFSTPPESSASSPLRRRNAQGHKPDCSCMVCKRLQAAIAAGKPSKQEVHLAAVARREARQKAKAEELSRRQLLRREEKKRKEAVVSATLLTQVQSGIKPSLELAAKVAGVSVPTAKKIAGEDFVQGALLNAGIDDTKLAEVAKEGIDAMIQKIVTDREGNIVDVINQPDWKNRHAFWQDLLRVKRILGSDAETGGGSGGLIIITPDMAKVLPGHPPACTCDGCLRAWEDKTAHLRRAAMKERAIVAEVLTPNSESSSGNIDWRQDPEAVEEDDFSAVESQPASHAASRSAIESHPTTDRVSNITRDAEHDEYGADEDDFSSLD